MTELTEKEEQKLLELAKKHIFTVDIRGDLEPRHNDSEDFVEASVWGLKALIKEAYMLGKGDK